MSLGAGVPLRAREGLLVLLLVVRLVYRTVRIAREWRMAVDSVRQDSPVLGCRVQTKAR